MSELSGCGETRSSLSGVTMHAGLYVRLKVPGAKNGRSLRFFMQESEVFSAKFHRRCSTAECIVAERELSPEGPERQVDTTIVRAPEVLVRLAQGSLIPSLTSLP